MAAQDNIRARLTRALRSRSNLRPVVLFCLGAMTALLGMSLGLSANAPPAFAILVIIVGVALGVLALAAIMLRPGAANDN